MHARGA